MSLKNCPDCGGDLGRSATKCRCGWLAPGSHKSFSGQAGTPCAADPNCKYFGRLWVRTIEHNQRLCVDHYYIAVEKDRSLLLDGVVPPVKVMAGVTPKPVAGRD
jgi:hypothetical protein